MTDEKTQEKDEKAAEKEMEKREEKWERDPLSAIVWALILIWAGVVLLASTTGNLAIFTSFLQSIGIRTFSIPFDIPLIEEAAWSVFFLGAGTILALEFIIRILIPGYRRNILGTAIVAIVFFGLALGTWIFIAPAILIAIGIAIIFGGLRRRK